MIDWYKLKTSEVLQELNTSEHGLNSEEVLTRQKTLGRNELPEKKPKNYLQIFFEQFASPIIYILFIATVIVFLLDEPADAMIILAVLVVNAIIGTIQEGKAQNTLHALKQYVKTVATVVRSGNEVLAEDTELVPGDILILQEGDKIPADARVFDARQLSIDQSALTGESEAIQKDSLPMKELNLPFAEQKNMVFRGTFVSSGSGKAIVVATGLNTCIGGISSKLSSIDTDVPLKKSIRSLSRIMVLVILVVCAFIFLIGISYGFSMREMFATAVAVAVSAIPEGLPVVVTLILSTGVYRMSKRNALVKKLQAVEALGQARVIAVDKTGTITLNQMKADELFVSGKDYMISGFGYDPKGEILFGGSVISPLNHPDILLAGKIAMYTARATVAYAEDRKEWQRRSGDPTEAALLVFAEKLGFKKDELLRENPELVEMPFSSETKYHATVNATGDTSMLSVVGAPEVIVSKCNKVWIDGSAVHMSAGDNEKLHEKTKEMSSRGLRVIALAVHFNSPKIIKPDALPELCFVGLVGIRDGLRPEVHSAIERARAAGVKIIMITGDHVETARAIAREAGIYKDGDHVLDGHALVSMSDSELSAALPKVTVFARVMPEHKLKIIEAYKKRKEIIAMTGDGVNDALSLAAADLGVAMGKIGTEVAKEAADIVLLDDNIESVVSAIEEGRNIYHTIKKVILYLFSTSIGEILAITIAIFLGYPLPVTASQIIWLNFVTDGFLVVALAMEPKEKGLLGHTHNRHKKIIDGTMLIRMLLLGLVMAVAAVLLFRNYIGADYVKATTMAMTVLAVIQWLNVWNCRSETQSVFSPHSKSNLYLVGATIIVIGFQIMALYTPFMQKVLNTVPITLREWGVIIVFSLSVIIVEEIRKLFFSTHKAR